VNLQSPRGIAVDQQNGKIYVAQSGNNSIAVVSFEGWQVSGVIPLKQPPTALLLDDISTRLFWSSAQSNSLSILDLTTRENIGSVDLAGRSSGMAWDQERGVAFVNLQDMAQVVAVNSKLQVVSQFKLNASQPTGIVYDGRTRRLYVAVRYAVLSISDQDGAKANRVAAPAGVDSLWLDPESRALYAASPGSLLVMRADGAPPHCA
jgi:DNA-binding beta-propeller fold protein YncE